MRFLVAAVAVVAATTLSGCDPGTVTLAFAPRAGDRYIYEVEVTTTTDLRLQGEAPRRRTTTADLRATHTVLENDGDTVRVRVVLAPRGQAERTLLVRFDRFGQLTEVEATEGGTTATGLGLPEVFPVAAGAPPVRALAPGETWIIDDDVRLPGVERARLTGAGRLLGLGILDGKEVATVESSTRIPVRRTAPRQRLAGEQTAESTATLDLADGAVRSATSITRGRFTVTLEPPVGTDTPPVRGRLDVEVRSEVRRTG